jgi:hypothetical protein
VATGRRDGKQVKVALLQRNDYWRLATWNALVTAGAAPAGPWPRQPAALPAPVVVPVSVVVSVPVVVVVAVPAAAAQAADDEKHEDERP